MRIVDYNACLLDGPDLRGALLEQEKMLEESVKSMRRVIDSFNRVRETGQSHSEALLAFSRAIRELGGADKTDSADASQSHSVGVVRAEREMSSFFGQLSRDLDYIEEARRRWLENSQILFVNELTKQRTKIKEFLSDTKREYYEETRRFYHNQEKALAKSGPPERDMDSDRLDYFGRTYEYVKSLQFKQAKNKIRFFEIIATLQSVWKCFYQECNDNLGERERFMQAMNESVTRFNSSIELAEQELEENKRKIVLSGGIGCNCSGQRFHEGYLLLAQKKLGIPTSWQRCYGTLSLDNRQMQLQPYSPANPGASAADAIIGCVATVAEDAASGRRFAFEVTTIEGRSLLLQAYSSANYRAWIRALNGQNSSGAEEEALKRPGQADSDRLIACLRELEARGLQEPGLYRVEGLSRAVDEFVQGYIIDGSTEINLSEINIRVLSSSVKRYLKQLPEPLLTFAFVQYLVETSSPSSDNQPRPLPELRDRLSEHLPPLNRRLLIELVSHFRRVARESVTNLMPVDNIALVFALTMCWPRQINLQSIQLCTVEGKQLVGTLVENAETLLPEAFPAAAATVRAPMVRQASGDDIIEASPGFLTATVPPPSSPRTPKSPTTTTATGAAIASKLHRLDQMSFNLHGPKRCARTLYPCSADANGELSFDANEIVYDVQKIEGEEGWCCGVINGKRGLIPLNYIEMLQ